VKITGISAQTKNPDRVNVSVDGSYRFSLDIFQLGELGIKVGNDYSDEELTSFEQESQFGKLYGRALEYTLMRPHSAREIKDYLWRKTRDRKGKEGKVISGYSPTLSTRVLDRLQEKGYVDDRRFAQWWVENRNLTKGTSQRKLSTELMTKGVDRSVIDEVLGQSERSDTDEIKKVIEKKRKRYPDENKLIQYLMRQGFRYDDILAALGR
jgi:regulatory protein